MERKLCNDNCIKETAKELGLTTKQVKEIVDVQSQYIKYIIENGFFDSVRLVSLGLFASKPKEIQMLEHLKGMTPEQAREFKKLVRTGKIKLNTWEKTKLKQHNGSNN